MPNAKVPRKVRLQLPEPPNTLQAEGSHWSWAYKQKIDYQSDCWTAALSQHLPIRRAVLRQIRWRVSAEFRLWEKRDPVDNLPGSFKCVLDALKAKHQLGDSLKWKNGLALDKGYIYDDAETWIERGTVIQKRCRKSPPSPEEVTPETRGVELVLTVAEVYPPDRFRAC